jgi:hypothetical protein
LIEYAQPQYGRATWWLLVITVVTLIAFHTRRKDTEPPQ